MQRQRWLRGSRQGYCAIITAGCNTILVQVHYMIRDLDKKRNCLFPALLLVVLFLAGIVHSAWAVPPGPIEQIKGTVENILLILREKDSQGEAAWEEKEKRITIVVEKRFDFTEMSKLTLASHWKKRSPDEKTTFTRLFSKLLETTYINRMKAYSDEDVVYKGQEVKGRKAVVHTSIVKNNAEIPISYKLKNTNGKWMVYDVIIEGVSLIRNYRSQFTSIMSREKYPGLIKRMEAKLEKIENSQTDG